ncbi:MAG: hypothetical protein AAGD43_02395 [Pseudomonadota bacterium]
MSGTLRQRLLGRAFRWVPIGMACLIATATAAQAFCRQVLIPGNPPRVQIVCPPTPSLDRQQEVIARRNHLESNSYHAVPEAQRPEKWPLGSPAIQSCRFCLTPDRQNLSRLESLR